MKSTKMLYNTFLTTQILRGFGFNLILAKPCVVGDDDFNLVLWNAITPKRVLNALIAREDYARITPSYVWFTDVEARYVRSLSFLGKHDRAIIESLSTESCFTIRKTIILAITTSQFVWEEARELVVATMTSLHGVDLQKQDELFADVAALCESEV